MSGHRKEGRGIRGKCRDLIDQMIHRLQGKDFQRNPVQKGLRVPSQRDPHGVIASADITCLEASLLYCGEQDQ